MWTLTSGQSWTKMNGWQWQRESMNSAERGFVLLPLHNPPHSMRKILSKSYQWAGQWNATSGMSFTKSQWALRILQSGSQFWSSLTLVLKSLVQDPQPGTLIWLLLSWMILVLPCRLVPRVRTLVVWMPCVPWLCPRLQRLVKILRTFMSSWSVV